MKQSKPAILTICALTLFLGGVAFAGSGAPRGSTSESPVDFSGWYENADGHRQGLEESRAEGLAMVVYFRTDWCPYCRQFEEVLLSDPEVQEAVEGMVRVRVDPEAGDLEMALAKRYRVRGYPALFVHSAQSKAVYPVDRTTSVGGRRVMKTPEAFIRSLREAGGVDG